MNAKKRECLYCHELALNIRHTERMTAQVVRYVHCDHCGRNYVMRHTITLEKLIGFHAGRRDSSR